MTGPAGTLLEAALPEPLDAPVARIVDVHGPLLVLGSRQDAALADARAVEQTGVEVVRRHSGGGAVLLRPGRSLWIDVLLPRGDPRWVDDVGKSFHWLGSAWAAALAELGVPATVHGGALDKTPWGSLICFGATGPGEVLVGGRKVVGMSQRRTRAGARFQCLVHDAWEPMELLSLLVMTPTERESGSGRPARPRRWAWRCAHRTRARGGRAIGLAPHRASQIRARARREPSAGPVRAACRRRPPHRGRSGT